MAQAIKQVRSGSRRKWADVIILDTNDYREICYEFGGEFC